MALPSQPNSVVIGSFDNSDAEPRLYADGIPIRDIGSEVFSIDISKVRPTSNDVIQAVKISSNVNLHPENITISNHAIPPIPRRMEPLSIQLQKGIDFRSQEYPDFLAEVSGISGNEPWGRWTDANLAPAAKFRFKQTLPVKFLVEITATAFGPNIGGTVEVRIGNIKRQFLLASGKEVNTYQVEFDTDGTSDTLEIAPPNPISPGELNSQDSDTRKLGLGLISIAIR